MPSSYSFLYTYVHIHPTQEEGKQREQLVSQLELELLPACLFIFKSVPTYNNLDKLKVYTFFTCSIHLHHLHIHIMSECLKCMPIIMRGSSPAACLAG